jgi:alkanesulfonate monooxygenase SsuD/methylene tetrahydromethanopterin reductase-like flavin-dependent oxidoreductase (luciferase family)
MTSLDSGERSDQKMSTVSPQDKIPPEPLFGINITPSANRADNAFEITKISDNLGIDLISVQDHPYNGSFFDTWTLITALAMSARNAHLMTNVADVPLRHPPLLAKSAATLDILTKGRVELGVGAGAFWKAIIGYGGPSRTPAEAVGALEEAIQIMRLMWNIDESTYRATFNGKFYRLDGAQTGPRPFHPIRIWLGALGPKMLSLTGRLGDGWTVSYGYAPLQQIPKMQQTIDQSLAAARRKTNEVRRNYNLAGIILESDSNKSTVKTDLQQHANGEENGLLTGSVEFWVDTIIRFYKDLRMDSFTFWPANESAEEVELFAKKVVPRVKEEIKKFSVAKNS